MATQIPGITYNTTTGQMNPYNTLTGGTTYNTTTGKANASANASGAGGKVNV